MSTSARRATLARVVSIFVTVVSLLFVTTARAADGTEPPSGDGASSSASSSASSADAGAPPPNGRSVLDFELDQAKKEYERQKSDLEALERERALVTTPRPVKFDGTKLWTTLRALREKTSKPTPTADCSTELALIDRLADPLLMMIQFIPWVESERFGAAQLPAVVQEVRGPLRAKWSQAQPDTIRDLLYGSRVGFDGTCAGAKASLDSIDTALNGTLSSGTSSAPLDKLFTNARTDAEARASDYRTALDARKQLAERNLRDVQKRIVAIDERLAKLSEKDVKLKFDTNIDIINRALFAMPLFVIVLFVGSHFFDGHTQEKLFAHRTVVELVGLALILMTIIILGTSGKVEVPAMGALLGSIAGYVFGQQAQRMLAHGSPPGGGGSGGSADPSATGGGGSPQGAPVDPKATQAAAPNESTPAPSSTTTTETGAVAAKSARSGESRVDTTTTQERPKKLRTEAVVVSGIAAIGGVLAFGAGEYRGARDVQLSAALLVSMLAVFVTGITIVFVVRAIGEGRPGSWRTPAYWAAVILILAVLAWIGRKENLSVKWLLAIGACVSWGIAAAAAVGLWQRHRAMESNARGEKGASA